MKVVSCLTVALCSVALMLAVATAQEGQKSQTIKGQIKSIAEDSKSLKMTEKGSETLLTMQVTPTTKVKIDGENAKLSDLKANDRIECVCTKTEQANTYTAQEIRRNKADQSSGR